METRTYKDRVTAAFKALRKLGYVARQNFTCCSTCGSYELSEMVTDRGGDPDTAKVVWYHRQDAEAFDHGRLTRNLMLRWNGDVAEITRALEAQGLRVIHNGEDSQCIQVACYDDFTHRMARRIVRGLSRRGCLREEPNSDPNIVINDVAEELVAAGLVDPTIARAAALRRIA